MSRHYNNLQKHFGHLAKTSGLDKSVTAKYIVIALFFLFLLVDFKHNGNHKHLLDPPANASNIFTRRCLRSNDVDENELMKMWPPRLKDNVNSVYILVEDSMICLKGGQFVQGHTYFTGESELEKHTQCISAMYDVYIICSTKSGRLLNPRAVSLSPLLPRKNYKGYFVEKNPNEIRRLSDDIEKYTVYIMTYDRDELLKRVLKNYAQSVFVKSIIISWNNLQRVPPDLSDFADGKELHVIQETTDSLNNRFKPHPELIKTRAVFNVDDDIIIPYPEVDFAFFTWRKFPDTLIGFSQYARSHSKYTTFAGCDQNVKEDSAVQYSIECNADGGAKGYYGAGKFPGYSIMLDSAVFFHAKYLDLYWDSKDIETEQGRALVDETRNCEDFVMPILIALRSGEPPVMVDTYDANQRFTSIRHLQHKNKKGHHPGLNTMSGHYTKRSDCLEKLGHIYGGDALQHSIFKVKPLLPMEII